VVSWGTVSRKDAKNAKERRGSRGGAANAATEMKEQTGTLFSSRGAFILAISLTLFGCATNQRQGDATLETNGPSWPFQAVDQLHFPDIPAGKRAVYSYQVLNLPHEIYPHGFNLVGVPPSEAVPWLHDQPWRNCVIRASLVTLEGHVFFSKNLAFAHDWNGNSDQRDLDHAKLWFPFTDFDFTTNTSSLPVHLSYVLRVEIINPSLRGTDTLEVEAHASPVKGEKPR
jgi:hypothetical protein